MEENLAGVRARVYTTYVILQNKKCIVSQNHVLIIHIMESLMCGDWGHYLCCGEEDVVRYVAHSTSNNAQSDSGEDVGVVSLAGDEAAPVSQRHFVERTATGEDAPALKKNREEEEDSKETQRESVSHFSGNNKVSFDLGGFWLCDCRELKSARGFF